MNMFAEAVNGLVTVAILMHLSLESKIFFDMARVDRKIRSYSSCEGARCYLHLKGLCTRRLKLLFERCGLRISSGTETVLTESFRGVPQSLP